jgi:DNA topoisomerase IA
MAEHIKTVLTREYAIKDNQVFRPTPLGSALARWQRPSVEETGL